MFDEECTVVYLEECIDVDRYCTERIVFKRCLSLFVWGRYVNMITLTYILLILSMILVCISTMTYMLSLFISNTKLSGVFLKIGIIFRVGFLIAFFILMGFLMCG